MKKIVIKLGVFLLICIIFSIIYLFIPNKNFGGINKIQTILEEELVEKAVEKKIKETFKNKNSSDINLNSISSEINNVIDISSTDITNIKKESYFDKYFDRLYFSIVTGTTLGFGDIYPNSKLTKLLVILHLVILFLIIAF